MIRRYVWGRGGAQEVCRRYNSPHWHVGGTSLSTHYLLLKLNLKYEYSVDGVYCVPSDRCASYEWVRNESGSFGIHKFYLQKDHNWKNRTEWNLPDTTDHLNYSRIDEKYNYVFRGHVYAGD
jgi:hypothetical protein